jgi:hypothetical protein
MDSTIQLHIIQEDHHRHRCQCDHIPSIARGHQGRILILLRMVPLIIQMECLVRHRCNHRVHHHHVPIRLKALRVIQGHLLVAMIMELRINTLVRLLCLIQVRLINRMYKALMALHRRRAHVPMLRPQDIGLLPVSVQCTMGP